MKLNRAELRKILYDFNSISNRLIQANFMDYNTALLKFIDFIKSSELIYEYIKACGDCEKDLSKVFKEVQNSYGRSIFSLGISDSEEVRNVFAILNYIAENNIKMYYDVALGYSSSNKYQDKIKGFNDRVVMVLISHIERYLTKIGIDMGIDERVTYSITVGNGQVNIANDNSTITATSIINTADFEKLSELIEEIKKNAVGISEEDYETLLNSLDVIQEEIRSPSPRRSFIKTAISGLKNLKNTAEFAAAIATLVQFVQPFIK